MARINIKDPRGGRSGTFHGNCGATILNDNWLMSGTVYLLLFLLEIWDFLAILKSLPGISLQGVRSYILGDILSFFIRTVFFPFFEPNFLTLASNFRHVLIFFKN